MTGPDLEALKLAQNDYQIPTYSQMAELITYVEELEGQIEEANKAAERRAQMWLQQRKQYRDLQDKYDFHKLDCQGDDWLASNERKRYEELKHESLKLKEKNRYLESRQEGLTNALNSLSSESHPHHSDSPSPYCRLCTEEML